MAIEVLLPKLGLTMQEGTITEWLVPAGRPVRTGDVIMRLATDKVDTDVEAEAEGLFHPLVPEGTTLPPGALVGWLLAAGEVPPTAAAPSGGGASAQPGVPSAAEGDTPDTVAGNGAAPAGRLFASPNARRVARERGVDIATVRGTGPGGRIVSEDVEAALAATIPAAAAAAAVTSVSVTGPRDAHTGPGLTRLPNADGDEKAGYVSPLVRRHADTLGVDIATVVGTGTGGRVRRVDVDRAAAAVPQQPPSKRTLPAGPRAGDVLPLTGMRGAIARSMHASLQEMAQLTHGYRADVTDLVALRDQLKGEWTSSGDPRVPSLNDFVVRAAALALLDHPLLNATIRDDGVHLLADVHVGVAVAVPNGLLVPVIRDAATRGVLDIAEQTRRLALAARAGELTLPDLEGATFVVTSLGGYGVDFFTPVINPPNVAILGVGQVHDGVRWEGETPRRTSVLTLSLTFDHRAVDGAPAAEYLRSVTALLARPLRLLAA